MGPQAGLMVPRLTSRHEISALKAAVRAPENWQAGSLLDARVPVGFLGRSESCGHGGHQGLQSRSFWTKRHCWKEGRKWRGVSLETLWQEGLHSKRQQLTLITATGGALLPMRRTDSLQLLIEPPSQPSPVCPPALLRTPHPQPALCGLGTVPFSLWVSRFYLTLIGIWLASALPCPAHPRLPGRRYSLQQ